jgi:hypothetical protein
MIPRGQTGQLEAGGRVAAKERPDTVNITDFQLFTARLCEPYF